MKYTKSLELKITSYTAQTFYQNPELSPLSASEWLHLIILIISNVKKNIMALKAEQISKWERLSSLGTQSFDFGNCWHHHSWC